MDLTRTTKVQGVKLRDIFQRTSCIGTLYITLPAIFFIDSTGTKEVWIGTSLIRCLDGAGISTAGAPLVIRCKDFRNYHFIIPSDRERQEVFTILNRVQHSRNSFENLPCFNSQLTNEAVQRGLGWDSFDLRGEFARIGVPNELWLYTTINADYSVCDTYPRHLFVASTDEKTILGSGQFRSRGRLPVLTYLHRNGKAALCRCSQPLAGLRAQCREDQDLVADILSANPGSSRLYVVDTRPIANAITNKVQGKGWENEKHYKNTVCQFFPIHNIHVMRGSLERLVKACQDPEQTARTFLSEVDGSGWLGHLKTVLDTATFIAQTLESGSSVVVHCSDGWDRTAQTCALAQLLLDPHYRTVEGFLTLIDKDWLSFGHKFADRCGQLCGSDPNEISPIFTQFLDCVWQLMRQTPAEFQFNEALLLALHDAAHSGQFGNFVANCLKEREALRVREQTLSFWSVHKYHEADYCNCSYSPDPQKRVLTPSLEPQMFSVWHGLYNRGMRSLQGRNTALQEHLNWLRNHNQALKHHQVWLAAQIRELSHRLGRDEEEVLAMSSLPNKMVSGESTGVVTEGPEQFHQLRKTMTKKSSLDTALTLSLPPASSVAPQRLRLTHSSQRLMSEDGSFTHPLMFTHSVSIEEETHPQRPSWDVPNDTMEHVSRLRAVSSANNMLVSLEVVSSPPEVSKVPFTREFMNAVVNTLAVDWLPLRTAMACQECRREFESEKRKLHCYMCGRVFCRQCTKVLSRLLCFPPGVTETIPTITASVPVLCLKCHEHHQELCRSLAEPQDTASSFICTATL